MPQLLPAGSTFPALSWPDVAGGTLDLQRGAGWRALVIYRGRHCPLCRRYLAELDRLLDGFDEAGVSVAALSADTRDKASADVSENGWKFQVGYDLAVAEMRELGLFVSLPRSPVETDRPFAEPALFVINPHGALQLVDVSNAPFVRPDLGSLLTGLKFIIAKDYPIRGTG